MSSISTLLDAVGSYVDLRRELFDCIDGRDARGVGDIADDSNAVFRSIPDLASGILLSDFAVGLEGQDVVFPFHRKSVPDSPGVYLLWNRLDKCLDYQGHSFYGKGKRHEVYDESVHVIAFIETSDPISLERRLLLLNRPRKNTKLF